MQPWLAGGYNPSSLHALGRKARAAVEDARKQLAQMLHVDASGIVFTASGTEANNQALQCLGATEILYAATDHAAITKASEQLKNRLPVRAIPVMGNGLLDMTALQDMLHEATTPAPLVTVMAGNNETGLIQPIEAIADIVHHHHALLHVDACQAFGKIPFPPTLLGVDACSIASHKLGGPVGAAALVTVTCRPVSALLVGGGQELNRRAGTENVAAIVGFTEAARIALEQLPHMAQLQQWRDAMEAEMMAYAPDARIIAHDLPRLPNTSCILMPGVENSTQLMHFDLAGIAVSSGSACTSGKVEASHVLQAMGLPKEQAQCALRVSIGWATQEHELQRFSESWKQLYHRKAMRQAGSPLPY